MGTCMKTFLAAAFLTVATILPAAAQDFQVPTFTPEEVAAANAAIEELALDDQSSRELWCGAAFLFISGFQKSQGDEAAAKTAETNAMTLFARVETTLLPRSLTTEELNAVGANATIVAISEMGGDASDASYSEEECTATAAE